ncbi:MAG: A/G-specific adenine glycosylase [Nitriliruptorales bacterium]|nr:A/G-specific adenine glycosylase [Nitriliruptorales bacterium]
MPAAGAFQDAVLVWYGDHRRDLPWRDIDDPFAVLVSEVMLQQTQVSRVVPKYGEFMVRFPDAATLAAAPVAEVVRMWRGLGYNRRAIALHRAARMIVEGHQGEVPAELTALQALPGIGAYTARAVLAFAFSRPTAPVDTNVARVIARALGEAPVRGAALQAAADELVPKGRARDWSAALMDLGATHCTSGAPRCEGCPVRSTCTWSARGGDDPVTAKRGAKPFAGSNRYHRGRLLDALRLHALPERDLPGAAAVDSAAAARDVADGLVADGLAQWHGDTLRLPA